MKTSSNSSKISVSLSLEQWQEILGCSELCMDSYAEESIRRAICPSEDDHDEAIGTTVRTSTKGKRYLFAHGTCNRCLGVLWSIWWDDVEIGTYRYWEPSMIGWINHTIFYPGDAWDPKKIDILKILSEEPDEQDTFGRST